jgi:hypothetical protein
MPYGTVINKIEKITQKPQLGGFGVKIMPRSLFNQ